MAGCWRSVCILGEREVAAQMNAVDRLGRFEIARRLFAFEQPNAFHGFKRDVAAAKQMDDERGAGWDGAGSMNPAIDRAWLNAQQLG